MRMLMNVELPIEPFNTEVRNGTAGASIAKCLEAIKPEAVYFTEQHGRRGAILIVNVDKPSQIPALAEPLFLKFNAEIRFQIVMSPDELASSGIDQLGKTWR